MTSPPEEDAPDADGERVLDLLEIWSEAADAGRDVPPEVLCTDCPELLPEVAAAVAALRLMAAVRGDGAAPFEAPPDPLQYRPGEVVAGRFVLESEIARGGTAVIWRCRAGFDRQPVALKLPRALRPDRDVNELFRREGERAERMFHRNIVPVYAHGQHGEVAYIAFKLVDGETLAARIGRVGRYAPEAALDTAFQIAHALAYAHGQGLIHRDLKPANVLVASYGGVYVTDFGIALTVGEAADGLSGLTGTRAYMAPEQLAGESVTPACDVYAFGIILHELLTGTPPVEGKPLNAPRGLGALVSRCLSTDPAVRYRNGSELLFALRLIAPPPGASSTPRPFPQPAQAPAPPPAAPPVVRWGVRSLRWVIPAAALALLLLGVGWAAVVQPVPVVVGVVAACLVVGLVVVKPQRTVLAFVVATVVSLALAALIGGSADSLLKSVTEPLNKALRVP